MVRLPNLALGEEPRLGRAICWHHGVMQPSFLRLRGKYAIRKNPSREVVVEGKIGRLYGLTVDKQCHGQEGATGLPNPYKLKGNCIIQSFGDNRFWEEIINWVLRYAGCIIIIPSSILFSVCSFRSHPPQSEDSHRFIMEQTGFTFQRCILLGR